MKAGKKFQCNQEVIPDIDYVYNWLLYTSERFYRIGLLDIAVEIDLSESIDHIALAGPRRRSRLPWSICLPLLAILSLVGWLLFSLLILVALRAL
jgi:hypothetical protein